MSLYFASISDKILGISLAILITFILVIVFLSFVWAITNDGYSNEQHEGINKTFLKIKKLVYIPILALILFIFIPPANTIYLILGTNYLQDSGLPKKVTEILNYKLDDILIDMKTKKEKND